MDPRHLRMLGVGVAVVAAGLGFFIMTRGKEKALEPEVAVKPEESGQRSFERREQREQARQLWSVDMRIPVRPFDREVLAAASKPFPQGVYVIQDVLPKSPAKVKFQREEGMIAAKVDLNRNGVEEESWMIRDDGTVERRVTARDHYRDFWVLDGDYWNLTRGMGLTSMTQPHERTYTPIDLRPFDATILERARRGISAKRQLDVFPGEPYQVNLIRGGAPHLVVELDLNRNGWYDERWEMGDPVTRRVSPADNGRYVEEYELKNQKWLKRY